MDGRQNVYNKLNQIFADAKDSIDYSTSSSGLIRAYKAHSERMEAARKNGAKVRVLSPISAENSAVAQDFSQVIELKRLEEPFIADFAIVDGKELVVTESKPDDLRTDRGSDLGIWTTNRLLIELHGQSFDRLGIAAGHSISAGKESIVEQTLASYLCKRGFRRRFPSRKPLSLSHLSCTGELEHRRASPSSSPLELL